MKIYEHRIKLFLTPDEFSQFFNYYSEGRLLGSAVDLETDLESYFEGVGAVSYTHLTLPTIYAV